MSTRILQNYINGVFSDHDGDFIPVLNRYTDKTIVQGPETSLDEVNRAMKGD